MKAIIIGMDGVTFETFERGWTPFIEGLLKSGKKLFLTEDLLSRGWSEIVTGKHAIESGALYERPQMGRGYGWTESFKLNDMPGLGERIKPIWETLNSKGYKVGVMNVPTTYPSPKVNGFFVSGGGGGGPVEQKVLPEQCYPSTICKRLNDSGYILDERFGSLLNEKKLYDPWSFFSRIEEMIVKRTDAFINLSLDFNVDFGFVVYKSSTVGAESLLIPELLKKSRKDDSINSELLNAGIKFFGVLDDQIKRIVSEFPECKIFFVSDHSTVAKVASINLNSFLIEKDYQKPSFAKKGFYSWVKGVKHLIPSSIREKIKKNPGMRKKYESLTTFDTKNSQAFSMGISNGLHGIYINDSERFGGPVDESDIPGLAKKIAEDFNKHPEAKMIGAIAQPKEKFTVEKENMQFPDVIIDLPDGYQTAFGTGKFIEEYSPPEKAISLRDAAKDLRMTGKGKTPLAVAINYDWAECDVNGPRDLTVIYEHVVRLFR